MRRTLTIISFAILPFGSVGCRAGARSDVRGLVDKFEPIDSRLSINNPETESWLTEIGGELLAAGRDINKSEEYKPKPPLHVYSRFAIYAVPSANLNAGTHGDDYAYICAATILEADTPEEVVAVLAHEFGHIRLEHLTDRQEKKREARARFIAASALVGRHAEPP